MNNIPEFLESFSIKEIEEWVSHLKRKRLRKVLVILKTYKDDLDMFSLKSQIEIYNIIKNNGILQRRNSNI